MVKLPRSQHCRACGSGKPGRSLRFQKTVAEELIEKGMAYYAFDTAESLDLQRKELEEKGYEVISPRDTAFRGGHVTINPPESYAVSRALIDRDIKVDYRENAGIRVAPHFYNTDEEVHEVIDTITEILEDGSWKQHKESRDFVT